VAGLLLIISAIGMRKEIAGKKEGTIAKCYYN
jgi:hypothetical protein